MTTARAYHTDINKGTSVSCWWNNGVYLNSAELFDPLSGTWTTTISLNTARAHHTASILANGKVLAAGGQNLNYLNSAELFP